MVHRRRSALVIHLNQSLTNNIPSGRSLVAIGNIDGSTVAVYYENGLPTVCSGWKKDNYGNYYYFQNSSTPLTNQFITDNNAWYYVNASGQRTTGWVYANGCYYYLDSSTGAMVTGWIQLNNIWYYLGADGAMYTGYTYHQCFLNILSILTDLWSHLPWVGNKYYGADGVWIPYYQKRKLEKRYQWLLVSAS